MRQRTLGTGTAALTVSALGFGAMALAGYYGGIADDEAARTIVHALDRGVTLIDTADAYADGRNEQLVGRALVGRPRAEVIVATKFGIVFAPGEVGRELPTGWGYALTINGTRDYARRALDASLRRLGTDYVDLWYAHYPDPGTPIEETVGAMAELVRAGKVRQLGLSNVTAEQVRRAQAVHPIAAVQYEYSLWRREVEAELLPTLRELGIGLVPWSPLGSGFLTGQVTGVADDDFRRNNPRYQGENLRQNLDRFAPFRALARELGVTPAQLALAWLLHQGDDIVPIPGTRKPERIDENAGAAAITLTPEHLARIDALAPAGLAVGQTLV